MPSHRIPTILPPALWKQAGFKSLYFGNLKGNALLGLVFGDAAVATNLFEHWRHVLGWNDEHGLLRIALVFGRVPKLPTGYFLRIGPDHDKLLAQAEAALGRADTTGIEHDADMSFEVTRHMPTDNPLSDHMRSFLTTYKEHGEFALVPLVLSGSEIAPLPVPALAKRDLVIRKVEDIAGDGDIDAAVKVGW